MTKMTKQINEKTFIGDFTDKLMLYAWDIMGLVLVVGMIISAVVFITTGNKI
jgi:hypothetical protein